MSDAQNEEQQPSSTAAERHASWLELFFDLIVVAGIAQLAHVLHGEPSLSDLGLFALLYLSFWTIWMCFTVYGNVAGDRARTWTMLLGMLGMAILAASVAGVHEGEHLRAFAVTYVVLRFVASGAWRRRGEMLADWPVAQFSAGVTPWIVSIWVDGPARYWLWAAGLAIDLWATLSISARDLQRNMEARRTAVEQRAESRGGLSERDSQRMHVTLAHVDPAHLGERLGLFTIIVLGESVAQLVAVGSGAGWDHTLRALAFAGFLLLVSIWRLSLVHGYGGVPNLRESDLPPRLVLLLHCVATGALTALAAGLGASMEHRHDGLPDSVRWVLCASFAVYVAVALVGAVVSRRAARDGGTGGGGAGDGGTHGGRAGDGWGRLAVHLLPPLLLSLAVGSFGGPLHPLAVVWLLVAAVGWGLLGYVTPPAGRRGARAART
ncbi:low temperature requirement protein A [Streptomyces sp. NPDC047123]|uniref:low temperature requirement protein A n=1 Tax=Streptomyces sp. NPDC047123 TaxID=3155622 RepID=UPI0033D84E45